MTANSQGTTIRGSKALPIKLERYEREPSSSLGVLLAAELLSCLCILAFTVPWLVWRQFNSGHPFTALLLAVCDSVSLGLLVRDIVRRRISALTTAMVAAWLVGGLLWMWKG